MDPNANRDELITLAESTLRAGAADPIRLAELVLALDEWLTKGGALPEPWGHRAPGPGCLECPYASESSMLLSWNYPDGADWEYVEATWGSGSTRRTSLLRVEYDLDGKFAGGASFFDDDNTLPEEDVLAELAADMERLRGSEFIPIKPLYYRKEIP